MKRIKPQWFTGTANPEQQVYEGLHRELARSAAAAWSVVLKSKAPVRPLPAGSAAAS